MNLTKNFTKAEFACKCGCGSANINLELVRRIQEVRDAIGKPIQIYSGVRCKARNTAVGGASRSQHLLGNAADLHVDGMTAKELASAIEKVYNFPGLGIYPKQNFVHVDVRPSGRWRETK